MSITTIIKRLLFFQLLLFFTICCSKETTNAGINDPNLNDGTEVRNELSFQSIPKSNQLFARDENNQSVVLIEGDITGKMDSIRVTCTNKLTNLTSTYQQKIESKKFSLNVTIEAGLHEYLFKIFTIESDEAILFKEIDHVVCGDFYVIHGQSNAWAIDYDNKFLNLPDEASWIRTIGSMHVYNQPKDANHATNLTWNHARGTAPNLQNGEFYGEGMVGVLGISLGLKMIDSLKIPIAIINGAGGGGGIEHYLKTYDNDLNSTYGRLQYRIDKAGGNNEKIRGFIWNQGESDGGSSLDFYKSQLKTLYNHFANDFDFEKFYLIQTPPGCPSLGSHTSIREAQRQFAKEYPEVELMTRHGFTRDSENNSNYYLDDNCHYHAEGYTQLANWLGNLILDDLFGRNLNYHAPNIISIKQITPTNLVLAFDREVIFQESLILNGTTHYLKDYFSIENGKSFITEIESVSGLEKELILHLSEPLTESSTLTYLHSETYLGTNQSYTGPWVLSASAKTGAVGFTIAIE